MRVGALRLPLERSTQVTSSIGISRSRVAPALTSGRAEAIEQALERQGITVLFYEELDSEGRPASRAGC
jgi:hypothetical protein